MAKAVQRIEESLAKMKKLGATLSVVFLVAFIAMCAFIGVFLMLELVGCFNGSYPFVDFSGAMSFIALLLDYAIYGATLLLMRSVAQDVSCGRMPFTIEHAKRIKLIGWLFVAGFVIGLFCSPDFSSVTHTGGVDLGIGSDRLTEYPTLYIDIKSLVGAIVCFSLSAVWKYGALLQADSNDLL